MSPIVIHVKHSFSLDPHLARILELLMAGKQEFLDDLNARLDRIEGLLKTESDEDAAKDAAGAAEIADLKAQLADATARAEAGIATEDLQPLVDRLTKLEADAPNTVKGPGTDTGTATGNPTGPLPSPDDASPTGDATNPNPDSIA